MIDYRAPLDELPDPLPIVPLEKPFDVTITPPGSKSITNRAYVLAALAEGESKIIRPLRSEDTDALLDALCTLGAQARWEGEDVFIKGVAGRFPRGGSVNLGDGGTPTRFMIAVACLAAEPVIVDGSQRMRERPIAEGVVMLRQLGAKIEYVEEEGRLPVRAVPSEEFKGGELTIGKTASSQFISALLLIGPWLSSDLRLQFTGDDVVSESYIRVTIDLMGEWGADVRVSHPQRTLAGQSVAIKTQRLLRYDYFTESDASSAAYWFEAGMLCNGSRMEVYGIAPDSKQPDIGILNAIESLGAVVMGDESGISVESTIGSSQRDRVQEGFDFSQMPDASLAFAVCASVHQYPVRITGLHTLRVKETDRIAALANELRKVGCTVETTDDSITITPPASHDRAATVRERMGEEGSPGAPLPHGRGSEHSRGSDHDQIIIETYNDHRMAMSFAVLGLVRPGISICNPKCVAKSYPTFWQDFAKLYD